MVNKNYVAGRNFEYRIIKWLVDRGYYVVRSYASKGVFDLVAIPPRSSKLSRAICVQAKYSRKGKIKINPEEKIRLGIAAQKYKAYCSIAYNENKRLKWKLVNPYYYVRE